MFEIVVIENVRLSDLRDDYFEPCYANIDGQTFLIKRSIEHGSLLRDDCGCDNRAHNHCKDCLNKSGVRTGKMWSMNIIERREFVSSLEEESE